jgi:hypothetical protein
VKRRFLLDENVIHHAIKGVDEHDHRDLTSAELVLLIARNCHSITLNGFLHDRYMVHIHKLQAVKSGVLQPVFMLSQLVLNPTKAVWEYDNPPRLPEGCHIPAEDVDVVRSALISHPIFVSAEENLRRAINNCEALHLQAVSPREALAIAQET